MAYGILVVLAPPEETWPEGWARGTRYDLEFNKAWRAGLDTWEKSLHEEIKSLGANSVLSFIPLQRPAAVAQTNIWVEDAGVDLAETMAKASKLAVDVAGLGHIIRSVQILDWDHQP